MRPSLAAAPLLALLCAVPAQAEPCEDATVDVCFRPGPVSCVDRIVAEIDAARHSLLVQAYNFTTPAIIQAIGHARERGVDVRTLLDKENRQKRYTGATYLNNAGVAVRIDDKPAIAHNKIIVIDGELTIGGSYNYTASAERKNAENVTFIKSRCVAGKFAGNFSERWDASDDDLDQIDRSRVQNVKLPRKKPSGDSVR